MQEMMLGRPCVFEAELFALDRRLEVLQQPLLLVAGVLVPVILRHEYLSEVSELHRHRTAPSNLERTPVACCGGTLAPHPAAREARFRTRCGVRVDRRIAGASC